MSTILALAMSFRAQGGVLPHERQCLLNIQRTQFLAEADALDDGREFWDIELREPCTLECEPTPLEAYEF